MGNGRVLPVLAVEDQHLLVNENGSIIQVQNNIQRQVTPGDYVNVENTLGQDKAVGVAREDDPSGQHQYLTKHPRLSCFCGLSSVSKRLY